MQKLRDRVKGLHKQRREITSLRKAAASIDPDRILQRVAEKYQVDRERLVARGERGLHARNVAMWMIWETGNKSLREIGELFGGLDYATVAQRIRRTRSSHDSIAARKLKATMFDPDAPLPTLRTRPRARVSHSRPQLYQIGCEAEGLSQQLKVTPQQGHP